VGRSIGKTEVPILTKEFLTGGEDEEGANYDGNNDIWSSELASAGLKPLYIGKESIS
jgi:hypothetical protein